MASGNGDFNAFENSLVSAIQSPNIASELIGQDDAIRKLFLTLSYFMDENEAKDYAQALAKCAKYKIDDSEYLYMINAKVSVKGYRSSQIVDVLTQIQRLEEAKRQDGAKQQKGVKVGNY